jgi:hypothetical protein
VLGGRDGPARHHLEPPRPDHSGEALRIRVWIDATRRRCPGRGLRGAGAIAVPGRCLFRRESNTDGVPARALGLRTAAGLAHRAPAGQLERTVHRSRPYPPGHLRACSETSSLRWHVEVEGFKNPGPRPGSRLRMWCLIRSPRDLGSNLMRLWR